MKLFSKFAVAALVLGQTACSIIPQAGYSDQWKFESLIDVTTESVNVDLGRRNALAQVANLTSSPNLASATLYCSNTQLCERTAKLLRSKDVSYEIKQAETNVASLNFERPVARDCDNRFITNHINPYNLHHPTFGCANGINSAQMIRDKRQVTDPLILGPYDGFKATQNYDSYQAREFDQRVIEVQQERVTDN